MQRVFIAPDLPRAQLVLDRLTQLGLASHILNEHAGGLAGEIPLSFALPEVWVEDDENVVAARQVIEAMEAVVPSGAVKTCPKCGEESPFEFETCWQCEGDLDGR